MLWVNQPRRLAAHPKNGGLIRQTSIEKLRNVMMSSSDSYVVSSRTKEGHLFVAWKLENKSMKGAITEHMRLNWNYY